PEAASRLSLGAPMKACCLRSFSAKGLRERFRLAREDEGDTCEACGTIFRYNAATKWRAVDAVSTATIFSATDDVLDVGWARGQRDRARGVVVLQCWGCGAMQDIPDQPFTEVHFNHATGNCTHQLAMRNRRRGTMPEVQ